VILARGVDWKVFGGGALFGRQLEAAPVV